jgi:hypothetical protein
MSRGAIVERGARRSVIIDQPPPRPGSLDLEAVLQGSRSGAAGIVGFDDRQVALRQAVAAGRRGAGGNQAAVETDLDDQALMKPAD